MQYIFIFLHFRGVHDHDTDLVENKVNTMTKEHIKQAIANPTVAPRVVFSNLSQNVLADEDMGLGMGISSLPKPQVLFNVYLGFCKSYSSLFLILFNIVDFNKKNITEYGQNYSERTPRVAELSTYSKNLGYHGDT